MLPMLEKMAVELEGKADIVKFNCNKRNKELGQSLGIKVAPTFHLYRENKQVSSTPALRLSAYVECSARTGRHPDARTMGSCLSVACRLR